MENCHFLVIDKCDAWAVIVKEKADAYATFEVYKSGTYEGDDHTSPEALLFGDMGEWETIRGGLESIEPTATVFIKWDGCSSWTFEDGLHLCGASSVPSFARMIEFVFNVARKEIPMWSDL